MDFTYFIIFAQSHPEFRLPELQSVAELYGFPLSLPESPEDRDPLRPYMVLSVEKEEHVQILAKRCILVKSVFPLFVYIVRLYGINRSVYELYAQGSNYEDLHLRNRASRSLWSRYIPDTSFKFNVTAYNHKIPQSRQREVIESFSYMSFLGKIDMKNPEISLGCFEECGHRRFYRRILFKDHSRR